MFFVFSFLFQKQNNELLKQNQQLLNHVQQLLSRIEHFEEKFRDENRPMTYSRPNELSLLETSMISSTHQPSDLSNDSPDSGKGNEISSESLSDPFHDQSSSTNPTIEEHLTLQLTSFTNFAFNQTSSRFITE